MPPRLAHSKSRNGCQRCKARKVKCSETKPTCTSCQRHGLECVYGPVVPPKRTNLHSSSTSKATQPSTSKPPPTLTPPVSYPSPASTSATSISAPASSPLLPPAALSAVPNNFSDTSPETPARRLLELRLLSHFLTAVTRTFASNDQQAVLSAWRYRVPALALRFPFLLNAILATSALHLAVGGGVNNNGAAAADDDEMPHPPPPPPPQPLGPASEAELANHGDFTHIIGPMTQTDFAAVHQTYFDLALSQHRAAIDVLGKDNADAICVTSVLISNHGFLLGARQGYRTSADLVRDSRADLDTLVREYEVPLHWLQLSAGIREVVRYAQERLLTSDAIVRVFMSTFHVQAIEAMMREERCAQVFSDLAHFGTHPEPLGLDPPLDGRFETTDPDPTVFAVYDRALRYLGHIFLMIEARENKARVARLCMSFTSMIPKAYVRLVEQNRPRALVVLAHLFALTIALEDVWWFKGAAERHVRGLESKIPPEWQWAMEWPRRAVRREIWGPEHKLS